MNNIQKASYVLHLFFKSLCWLYPLVITYSIFFQINALIELGVFDRLISSSTIHSTHFSWLHRGVIVLIEWIPMTFTLLIFHRLAKLFKLYQRGHLFEMDNIKVIKQISIFMIIGELIELIYQPLMTIALTFHNPAGQHIASISMGSTNINSLITAFIILVASWIMKEAHQLKTDAQLTI